MVFGRNRLHRPECVGFMCVRLKQSSSIVKMWRQTWKHGRIVLTAYYTIIARTTLWSTNAFRFYCNAKSSSYRSKTVTVKISVTSTGVLSEQYTMYEISSLGEWKHPLVNVLILSRQRAQRSNSVKYVVSIICDGKNKQLYTYVNFSTIFFPGLKSC